MTFQFDTDLNRKYDATGASSKELQENRDDTLPDGSRKPSAGVKRKAHKSLCELEGEERVVALKMAKKSLAEIVQRQGKKPLLTTNVKSVSDSVFFLFDEEVPLVMYT